MRLSQLLKGVPDSKIVFDGQDYEREISGLFIDSREVKAGGLFVCLTGGQKDGHGYAKEAIQAGAVAVLAERELPVSVPQIIVRDSRSSLALISAAYYGYPAKQLKIIGVTGTNGKTTTTHLLSSILRRAGKEVATVGTLGVCYGKKKFNSTFTTPDPIYLQRAYADMVACGVKYVVEEVSAHALYYRKDAGTEYEACIFTNLSQDHLDFFQDMKSYQAAKIKLFDNKVCKLAVVNADEPSISEINKLRDGKGIISYGLKNPSDCFAIVTKESIYAQEFMLNLEDNLCRVCLKLTGRHNVYNALAAATCAYKLGVSGAAIAAGLNEITKIEGRLQLSAEYRGAKVFIDFAHTPDGLAHSLEALKRHVAGRLICVFGCGGNRDKSKRSIMGEVAAQKADFCILTSDNPRYEDPLDIIDEIERGVKEHNRRYVIVPDRKQAIAYALDRIRDGDVLLIAGKGGNVR